MLPSISPRASFRAMPPFAAAELVSRGSSRLNIQQSVGSCCASNPLHRHHITPPAHLISHYFIQNAFIINHKEYKSWCNAFRVSFGCQFNRTMNGMDWMTIWQHHLLVQILAVMKNLCHGLSVIMHICDDCSVTSTHSPGFYSNLPCPGQVTHQVRTRPSCWFCSSRL